MGRLKTLHPFVIQLIFIRSFSLFRAERVFKPHICVDEQILTLIAHFPPLEVEHCVVVGMDGQIQLHC